MIYGLLFLNIICLVTGQLLWKTAVSDITEWNAQSALSVLFSPYFLGGAFLYVAATALWLVILSKLPLSIAYPSQSLSYVIGAVLALIIFKEAVSPAQWTGMALILLGVVFIAK
ncbi:multidrug transporter EmrE-like cation transporter [Bacillus ectoiniformans]|uniref:EamA family transporter n=1 Tax=Bacillus ectoiniformans TaxID=1494429 RepID=UPI00195B76C8|nr:EamA family transporter [Bacillus ectoiniformans]MBM7649330.1 multidrug transporter EmrE-like cation transporter [Bacillus ectoiniformans]